MSFIPVDGVGVEDGVVFLRLGANDWFPII